MIKNTKDRLLSTAELAKILGISRIAVFQKIKQGSIKAVKVGRNFVIDQADVTHLLGGEVTSKQKKDIEAAVDKTIAEYGETLRLLGQE